MWVSCWLLLLDRVRYVAQGCEGIVRGKQQGVNKTVYKYYIFSFIAPWHNAILVCEIHIRGVRMGEGQNKWINALKRREKNNRSEQ